MNKTIIIAGLILCSQSLDAQTFNEWFRQKKTQKKYLLQQIAALKVYLGHLKEGYDIVKKGLNTVGDIKQGKFDLDNEYLESLRNVNPAVSGSTKVASIVAYQRMIMNEFNSLKDLVNQSNYFTPDERQYVQSVYANMLRESELSLDELDLVLSNSDLEMEDDERIKRVDVLYMDMKDKYTFIKSFSNSTRLLNTQRFKEGQDILIHKELVLKEGL